ncbi:AraC family transcriptional regulator [Devosia sp.]|uniref:AraC family transcriptional regulator n=1 Tax=Devosia sp. TaxID=1871048 RepID=UPI001AC49109|nr:AraC family transcriptional regulator [Devosia sp.]MBN9334892.1 helix-turn-helix transcriptional regulator [Devosia sp.]
MRLNYFLPSARMKNLLTIHAGVSDVEEACVEVLPAMLPNLHIRVAGHSSLVFADGSQFDAPPVSLIGPTTGAYRVMLSRDSRIAVVGLLPLGWAMLVRLPAFAYADRVLDGADIWGARAAGEVVERLWATSFDGDHVGIVEALLKRPTGANDHLLQQIMGIDYWLERSASLSLDALSAQVDLGDRQMRRIALEYYGAAPKILAMKYRALRLAAEMCEGGGLGVTLHAYADQSHMIRDFRRFVGWTPAAFLRDHNLAAATLSGRRRAGAERPLVLWS